MASRKFLLELICYFNEEKFTIFEEGSPFKERLIRIMVAMAISSG